MKYAVLFLALATTPAWAVKYEKMNKTMIENFQKACDAKLSTKLLDAYVLQEGIDSDEFNNEAYSMAEKENDVKAMEALDKRTEEIVKAAKLHVFTATLVKFSPTALEDSDEGHPGYYVTGKSDKGAEVNAVIYIDKEGECLDFNLDYDADSDLQLPGAVVDSKKEEGKPGLKEAHTQAEKAQGAGKK